MVWVWLHTRWSHSGFNFADQKNLKIIFHSFRWLFSSIPNFNYQLSCVSNALIRLNIHTLTHTHRKSSNRSILVWSNFPFAVWEKNAVYLPRMLIVYTEADRAYDLRAPITNVRLVPSRDDVTLTQHQFPSSHHRCCASCIFTSSPKSKRTNLVKQIDCENANEFHEK